MNEWMETEPQKVFTRNQEVTYIWGTKWTEYEVAAYNFDQVGLFRGKTSLSLWDQSEAFQLYANVEGEPMWFVKHKER